MRRLLATIDRWGPALVSVLALFVVCGVGWTYAGWISRVDGKTDAIQHELDHRVQLEIALRTEIQTWQAHVILLQRLMIESGLKDVPKPPQPVKESNHGRSGVQNHH